MTRDVIDARRLEFLTAAPSGPMQDPTKQERIETAPTIMLLGGYGNAGLHIARIVLAESDAHVILADRNLPAATAAAAALEAEFGPGRTSAARVDASDRAALTKALVAGGAKAWRAARVVA